MKANNILVTQIFRDGRDRVVNSIRLRYNYTPLGMPGTWYTVEAIKGWDNDAINKLGKPGGIVYKPDYTQIIEKIEALKSEYGNLQVQWNIDHVKK